MAPLDYVALRAGAGLLEGFDRHFAHQSYGRFRPEAGLRHKWWKIEPMLGGGMLIGVSPSAYWIGVLGVELAPGWSLTVEGRVGRFWDQRDADVEKTGFLEGQSGLSMLLW